MALDAAPLLCPFTVASDIFMLKKDNAKTHYNNTRLNHSDDILGARMLWKPKEARILKNFIDQLV
jgi:hypothetical protein